MQEAVRHGSRSGRPAPTRAEIEPAALDLIRRYGQDILRIARRYSLCADDAEDAYQRGLEILLTRAPSTRESDLLPWLKTVVKHEAFAVRRLRGRALSTDDGSAPKPRFEPSAPDTREHAERHERLRLGAEALSRLKPQEVRALLLKAQGLSYQEICEETSWTYTKVNRCLTEGRQAFLRRVEAIESGEECERLAPLLSRLADGEASAEDMAALRPHLRSCLGCRAALREFRAAPARVAAAVPVGVLALGGGVQADAAEQAAASTGSVVHWLHERAVVLWLRLHELAQQGVDLLTGSKMAAVAASTAAIAGGGAVAVDQIRAPVRHGRPAVAAHARHDSGAAKHPRAHIALPRKQRAALRRHRVAAAAQPISDGPAAPAPATAPAATPAPPPAAQPVTAPPPAPKPVEADKPAPSAGGEFGP